jgi:hypothetical protein
VPSPDLQQPDSRTPEARRSGWGCFFAGCGVTLVVGVGAVIALGVGGYFYLQGQVATYTTSAPRELPVVEYSEAESRALSQRLESFGKELQADRQADSFVLTADDINAILCEQPGLQGKIFIRLDQGRLFADVSIPLDDLPVALGSGRYFNGTFSVKVSLENGELIVTLDQAEIHGKKLPEIILAPLRRENLAKDLYQDPKLAALIRKFDRVIIEDETIVLVPSKVRSAEIASPGTKTVDERP